MFLRCLLPWSVFKRQRHESTHLMLQLRAPPRRCGILSLKLQEPKQYHMLVSFIAIIITTVIFPYLYIIIFLKLIVTFHFICSRCSSLFRKVQVFFTIIILLICLFAYLLLVVLSLLFVRIKLVF